METLCCLLKVTEASQHVAQAQSQRIPGAEGFITHRDGFTCGCSMRRQKLLRWSHLTSKEGRGVSEPPSTGVRELRGVWHVIPPPWQANEELTEWAALTVPAGSWEG